MSSITLIVSHFGGETRIELVPCTREIQRESSKPLRIKRFF